MFEQRRGIPLDNQTQLIRQLNKAQARAQTRLASSNEIRKGLEAVYKQLSEHLSKKDIIGLIVNYDPNAQTFPIAYKYRPYGTQILAKRTSKGWSVLKIARGEVHRKPFIIYGLESRQEALARFATKRLRTGCTL
ncbi:TPA: hypothetical protein QDZ12_006040 [Pseudomonas putida]|uniref:hypothetical protein n=1 Tax=Pseudomonas sp. HD6515 TaxID=2856556 RepID=UPI00217E94BC|nr:hypothetical protein [Pseudomonas sp. HD6515]ELS0924335.1 hypothetical protein [Pseudomonas putida]UWH21904.1 hypothetical protein KW568_23450 [Pseudomonas sp. HD6515]HDS0942671.1 hypothetical protein [Pseudomonas putida]